MKPETVLALETEESASGVPHSIKIWENCSPPKTTHHAKKIIRVGGFSRLADTEKLATAKSFWDELFIRNRPVLPFDCPVCLTIILAWPWNTSDTKKTREKGIVWQDTKPDCSNMGKTIEDALVRCGYIVNDSKVVSLEIRKYRGNRAGVGIEIRAAGIAQEGGE